MREAYITLRAHAVRFSHLHLESLAWLLVLAASEADHPVLQWNSSAGSSFEVAEPWMRNCRRIVARMSLAV